RRFLRSSESFGMRSFAANIFVSPGATLPIGSSVSSNTLSSEWTRGSTRYAVPWPVFFTVAVTVTTSPAFTFGGVCSETSRFAVRARRREETDEVLGRVVLLRHVHALQCDVWDDAEVLDRAIAGREVLGDRQLELALVVVVVELLDGALAERARADDDGAVEVL